MESQKTSSLLDKHFLGAGVYKSTMIMTLGSFTPLVFSTFGGMGSAATVAYKRLASMLSTQRGQSYSSVVSWIRCSTSFSLLRSAVTCLRGARSHRGSPVTIGALDLAISEGQVLPSHCFFFFFSFTVFLSSTFTIWCWGWWQGVQAPREKKNYDIGYCMDHIVYTTTLEERTIIIK